MMMAREVSSEEEAGGGDELRRGPWTVEEDLLLVNYIAAHGEGRWNALARCAGLKRTGKSCRLRWLNYLRPDVRRGNMTAEEQLLILELHGRWGNRWSKIAQHLPGRTDNEIKNFWRTHMRKIAHHAKKKTNSPSPAPTTSSGSLSSSLTTATTTMATAAALQESSSCGGDDEAVDQLVAAATTPASQLLTMDYTMDQLWNDIAAAEADTSCYDAAAMASPPSPVWEFCTDYSLWRIDDEEYYKKMLDASQ